MNSTPKKNVFKQLVSNLHEIKQSVMKKNFITIIFLLFFYSNITAELLPKGQGIPLTFSNELKVISTRNSNAVNSLELLPAGTLIIAMD